jgi:hypothetical protein
MHKEKDRKTKRPEQEPEYDCDSMLNGRAPEYPEMHEQLGAPEENGGHVTTAHELERTEEEKERQKELIYRVELLTFPFHAM